jgi:hypothetical protein
MSHFWNELFLIFTTKSPMPNAKRQKKGVIKQMAELIVNY